VRVVSKRSDGSHGRTTPRLSSVPGGTWAVIHSFAAAENPDLPFPMPAGIEASRLCTHLSPCSRALIRARSTFLAAMPYPISTPTLMGSRRTRSRSPNRCRPLPEVSAGHQRDRLPEDGRSAVCSAALSFCDRDQCPRPGPDTALELLDHREHFLPSLGHASSSVLSGKMNPPQWRRRTTARSDARLWRWSLRSNAPLVALSAGRNPAHILLTGDHGRA
jgi:hypothetical protein